MQDRGQGAARHQQATRGVTKAPGSRHQDIVGKRVAAGETVAEGQWPVYGLVFAAVAVLVADGAARVLRERRSLPPGA